MAVWLKAKAPIARPESNVYSQAGPAIVQKQIRVCVSQRRQTTDIYPYILRVLRESKEKEKNKVPVLVSMPGRPNLVYSERR
jgi:hypothetical protein